MNNIHIEAGPQRALRPMDRNTMISIADPTSRKPIIPLLPNIGQINCRAQAGKENNDCVPKKEDCKENPNEKSKTTISIVPAPPTACVAPAAQCTRPTESRIPVMRSRIPLATAPSNSNLQTLVTRPINLVRPTILSTASIRSNLSSMQPGPLRAPAAALSNVVRSFSQLVPIENIDNDTNCFLLSEYAPDIYKYLHELEMKQSIPVNFLSIKNASLTANMRAILINWLINVHNSFQLCSETLYICVSIIDRYFAREPVSKNKIQLVGATALFVAAKFEEIYYPDVQEFVMICDRLYTKKDIIRMELKILQVLRFELGRPLPLHFLRRGSKAAKADGRTHMMAKYLCELSLVEYECSHWNPSQLAAAALYLSARMNNLNEKWNSNWNSTLEHYTHYSEKQVQKWASVICRFILSSETSRFQNCRKKYSHTRYMEISKSSQLQMPFIRQLATVANRPKASS